jgi:hypothetical protein
MSTDSTLARTLHQFFLHYLPQQRATMPKLSDLPLGGGWKPPILSGRCRRWECGLQEGRFPSAPGHKQGRRLASCLAKPS